MAHTSKGSLCLATALCELYKCVPRPFPLFPKDQFKMWTISCWPLLGWTTNIPSPNPPPRIPPGLQGVSNLPCGFGLGRTSFQVPVPLVPFVSHETSTHPLDFSIADPPRSSPTGPSGFFHKPGTPGIDCKEITSWRYLSQSRKYPQTLPTYPAFLSRIP